MTAPDRFRVLRPVDGPESARQIVEALGLRAGVPAERPRVVAVMISAADGRATVDGRSGGLGSPADSDVLRAVRAEADALLVGSRTVRVERYGSLLDEQHRATRTERGMAATLRLVTVVRDLNDLPVADAPIFAEPDAPITVFTTSTAQDVPDPDIAADLEVVRMAPETLNLRAALDHLRTTHGVDVVTTEGGPTLLRRLVSAGLLDDLLHTAAPVLVAGDGTTMLAGDAFPDPVALRVRSVHQSGDHLFVHYAVAS